MAGRLFFKYASMNSGKSTALLQAAFNYEERGQKVLVGKPSVDTKDESVLSRLGLRREVDIAIHPEMDVMKAFSEELKAARETGNNIDCFLVDESQFLTATQVNGLFNIAVLLDIPVLAYGLRTDFQTHSFEGSRRLLEIAHSLEELKTICRCGKKALFNARKVAGSFVQEGDQVAIDGESAEYESMCGKCYIREVGQVH